jgi:hypothetical protein
MNTELTTELAHTIEQQHLESCRLTAEARAAAESAINLADQCGGYLHEVKRSTHGRLLAWLRDNVPSLDPNKARAYMGLHETRKHRQCKDIDKRQLQLIGILDTKEVERQERAVEPTGQWFVQVGRIREWWTKTNQTRPVSQWDEQEAVIAANQLKPIVEIYREIEARISKNNEENE